MFWLFVARQFRDFRSFGRMKACCFLCGTCYWPCPAERFWRKGMKRQAPSYHFWRCKNCRVSASNGEEVKACQATLQKTYMEPEQGLFIDYCPLYRNPLQVPDSTLVFLRVRYLAVEAQSELSKDRRMHEASSTSWKKDEPWRDIVQCRAKLLAVGCRAIWRRRFVCVCVYVCVCVCVCASMHV